MIRFLVFLTVFIFSWSGISGQTAGYMAKIQGSWSGPLKVQGIELRLVFNLTIGDNDSLTVTLDSPDQGAKGIATSRVVATPDSLRVEVKSLRGVYLGRFSEDYTRLMGQWKQGGFVLPLELTHKAGPFVLNRPQEPSPPYPYHVEEILFRNEKAGIELAGTFTTPSSGVNFPAVVLISGSGMQNRDEELMGHKPFLVLSDWLTRQGIAVLRYDDRGAGKSGGTFPGATSFDFADDAEAAFNFLKKQPGVDTNRCGIIGHSEGGLIAPVIASRRGDVDFIVLLAGPGLTGEQIIMLQSELISRAEGVNEKDIKADQKLQKEIYSVLKKTTDDTLAGKKITRLLNQYNSGRKSDTLPDTTLRMQTEMQVQTMTSPWFRCFLTFNPTEYLEKVKCKVLAMNGELDLQVPCTENLQAIERALIFGGNPNYRIEALPGLNHLFQHATTGSPSEYGRIEETFAPEALTMISSWINE